MADVKESLLQLAAPIWGGKKGKGRSSIKDGRMSVGDFRMSLIADSKIRP